MSRHVSLAALSALLCVTPARAQRGAGDWMTSAFDAQRSNWVRSDAKISRESLQKPGFELVWKMKFTNSPRQLNTITPPALLDFYIGYRGFRTLGFFGASADRIIAVDTDLARIEWEKDFAPGNASAGSLPCPGGLTSAVTRPTVLAYPAVPTGRGAGRGTPAKSGVGQPYEGAVTIRPTPPPAQPPPPRPSAAAKPAGDIPSPFAPRVQWLLALTGDGKLHSFWVSNAEEPNPAIPFVPPNSNAHGLIAFDNVAYVATTNGCGGADNGLWSLDLVTRKVNQWKSAAGVAGTAGPAVAPDGTLYATAGVELTALAPRTLTPVATYRTGGAEFTSSPVVFDFKGKNLAAAATSDGRLHLLDTARLSSALHRSEPFSSPGFATGALASWQDPAGTRWILAPASGAIAAFTVELRAGVPTIQPAWVSRDLVAPLPPIIVNGVVFALSSGEFRSSDPQLTAAQRIRRSANAVLYALDAATGKELWNSGATITSFVHSGGLAAGGSRVYIATYEGTQYAFGFPIEH